MASAKATTDRDEIRRWVEDRGGFPAHVKRTEGGDDPGVLRIDYPGFSGQDSLERIDWDQWFDWFDRDNLAFLYQPEGKSRFSKLVDRGSVSVSRKGARASSRKSSSSKKRTSSKKSASTKKGSSSKKASSKKRTSSKKASSKKASSKKTSSKKSSVKKASSRKSSAKKSASKKSSSKRTVSRKSSSSNTTTNRNEIRRWVEARGGFPARVKRTGSKRGDPGILRIDYPGFSGTQTLERIDWDEWFDWFDRDKLAFLYQNKPNSRFSKLVRR